MYPFLLIIIYKLCYRCPRGEDQVIAVNKAHRHGKNIYGSWSDVRINQIAFIGCAGIVAECADRAPTAQSGRAAKSINRIVFYGARRELSLSALTEIRLLKVGARQRELIGIFFMVRRGNRR
jgi:hypothetical protein